MSSSFTDLNALFKHHCPKMVVDEKMVKKLHAMMYGIVNRNEDHIHFFGGNLTGVHKMRFLTTDKNHFFSEIMSMEDISQATKDIKTTNGINPDWIISSDLFNMACLWLSHKVMNSTLKDKSKEDAQLYIYMLLHFKFLGSMLSRFFQYTVDHDTAKATYDALSMKFSLKKHGTWLRSLEARCKDIYAKDSIRYKTIKSFELTKEVVRMINDIENRLRIRIRRIYATMQSVIDSDRRHQTVSGSIQLDGEMVIKDVIRDHSQYEKYISRILLSPNDLIKPEFVEVVSREYPSAPEHAIVQCLKHASHLAKSNDRSLKTYVNIMCIHVFEQMKDNPTTLGRALKDPIFFISSMKNLYNASKSSNPLVLEMREIALKVVTKSVKIKDTNTLISLRNAVMLYLILRMFNKDRKQ